MPPIRPWSPCTTGATANVTAYGSTVGGSGGDASGTGETGGNGAAGGDNNALSVTTHAVGGNINATAQGDGGGGGTGEAGAAGGQGGDSTLDNQLTADATTGAVTVAQDAQGGAGGGTSAAGGTPGTGGDASSTLDGTYDTTGSLGATVMATGGAGGESETGTAVGGNAAGTATAALETSNAATVGGGSLATADTANAFAGAGGFSEGGVGGTGGNALATLIANTTGGTGAVEATADAAAGAGGGSGLGSASDGATGHANAEADADTALSNGNATALAIANAGSSGVANATGKAFTANGLAAVGEADTLGGNSTGPGNGVASAEGDTSGGILLDLQANATAPTDGAVNEAAGAVAEEGGAPGLPPQLDDNSYAVVGGLAQWASLPSNVAAAFGAPGVVNFGAGELVADFNNSAAGTTQVFDNSITFDVAGGAASGGDIELGLVSPAQFSGTTSSAFVSLTFDVLVQGTLVETATYNSSQVAAATHFFTHDVIDLGTAAPVMVRGVQHTDANVQVSLSTTVDTGGYYGVDFTVGETPCYAEGTLLLTPDGERRVETLAAGDLVMTAMGRRARVAWVGHRHVHRATPVRIEAGAFGPASRSAT